MNDTLRILNTLAQKELLPALQKQDPEWEQLEQERDTLQKQFMEEHQADSALIRQVIRLLDAQGLVSVRREDAKFLLGLQMGLELGSLRDIKKTE